MKTRLLVRVIIGLAVIRLVGMTSCATREVRGETGISAQTNATQQPWLELHFLAESMRPGYLKVIAKDGHAYYASPEAVVDATHIADVVPTKGEGGIELLFTNAAAEVLGKITAEHQGERLGVFVDGELVQAPVIRGTGLMRKLVLAGTLSPEQIEDFVRAWSRPPDTRRGKRLLHIQGLGDVEAEVQGGAGPGRVQFFCDGSLYNLPVSFVSRPEIPTKEQKLTTVIIRGDSVQAGKKRLKDSAELMGFVRDNTERGQLVMIDVSKVDTDSWTEKRKGDLTPLIMYVYENPYAGLRQVMPAGWKPARHEE